MKEKNDRFGKLKKDDLVIYRVIRHVSPVHPNNPALILKMKQNSFEINKNHTLPSHDIISTHVKLY